MNLRVPTEVNNEQGWEETAKYDNLYSFKWQPFSNGMQFDQISKYGLR